MHTIRTMYNELFNYSCILTGIPFTQQRTFDNDDNDDDEDDLSTSQWVVMLKLESYSMLSGDSCFIPIYVMSSSRQFVGNICTWMLLFF